MAEAPANPLTGGKKPFLEQQVTWLYTDDIERHAAFYRDVLELPHVMDQAVTRIFQVSPTSFLGVCDKEGRSRGNKGIMVTFLVENVEEAYAWLLAKGVVFEGPLDMKAGKTVYSAFFRDPEGYVLEIQEFRDVRWPYPNGRGPRGS